MNFTDIKYKANYYVLLMLAFVIPLERKLIAPVIILFLITSIFNGEFKRYRKKNILLFSSIYIFYLAGLIYSDNLQTGITDITTKLSLIIFPISFFLAKIDLKKNLSSVLKSFIDGCFVSAFIAILNSFFSYYYSFDISTFFYGHLAIFAHPSYLAMLMSLCIVILYYSLFQKEATIKFNIKVSSFLLIFFSIFILLLSSKTGLIAMLLIHLTAICVWIFKRKAFIKGISVLVVLSTSLLLTYNYSNLFKERIKEIINVAQADQSRNSSTSARKTIWITALDLIKNKPFIGYGTGDAKDILVKEYGVKGLTFLQNKRLNAHNQFLQTSLAIGLMGGAILVLMIIIPLLFSFKQKHYIYLGFLLIIILNASTEAILERQLGVVFYSFFNTLFFAAYFSNKSLKTEE